MNTVFACVTAFSASCAGGWDQGRNYQGKRTEHPDTHEADYRVGLPGPHWQPHAEKGAQVTWVESRTSSLLSARIQCEEHGDRTLVNFFEDLQLDFKEWSVVQQQVLMFAKREALRATITAKLDGVPMAIELLVLKKDGCLFDFWHIARPDAFEGGSPAFQSLLDGFEFPVGSH